MDTPSYRPLIPVTAARPSRKLLKRALLIGGALLLVLALGVTFWRFRRGGGLVGEDEQIVKDEQIVLVSDSLPLTSAQALDLKTGQRTIFTVEGLGTAAIIDAALTETHGYYLISDPTFTQVNLYRQDRANPSAGFGQLSTSTWAKYDLSFDELSGVAAYTIQDGEDARSQIAVFDTRTNSEKVLEDGSQPTVLPGGFFVMFQQGSSILSVNVQTGEVHELLSIVPGMPFAADPAEMRIALYDPVSHSVQQFTISPMTSASYETALPLPEIPNDLLYVNGTLVAARTGEGSLLLENVGEGTSREIPGAFSLEGYNLMLSP